MEEYRQKTLLAIFSIITVSLLISLSRQLVIHYQLSQRLAQKNEELGQLVKKNQALEKSIEQAKTQKFLDEQARKLLGMSSPVAREEKETFFRETKEEEEKSEIPEIPNYRRWMKLFMY